MISVGIPVYHPKKAYLEQTIHPVIEQLSAVLGAQVFVYDDSGVDTEVAAWLMEWQLDSRVSYIKGEKNLGLAGAWNQVIARSSQPLIHILHQDDIILEGFYAAVLGAFAANPGIGAVLNRTLYVDGDGTWITFSLRAAAEDGILSGFNRHVFDLDIQCPGMVVRREVYRRVGGFDESLLYQLDREMWTRMSGLFDVYYLRQPMNCFRIHPDQRSTVLLRERTTLIEGERVLALLHSYYKGNDQKEMLKHLRLQLFRQAFTVLDETPGNADAWRIAFSQFFLRTLWNGIRKRDARPFLLQAILAFIVLFFRNKSAS